MRFFPSLLLGVMMLAAPAQAQTPPDLDKTRFEDLPIDVQIPVANNRFHSFMVARQYDLAQAWGEKTLDLAIEKFGANTAPTGAALASLGALSWRQHKLDDAVHYYTRAFVARRAAYGADAMQMAEAAERLAQLQRARGRMDLSEPLQLYALNIRQAKQGDDSPYLATPLYDMGHSYLAMGQPATAVPYLTRAYDIRLKALGPDAADTKAALADLTRATR